MVLPPRQKFGDALRAAGVKCENPRGWWGGINAEGVPVVTTWIDGGRGLGPGQFWIWQPGTNHGGLRHEWLVGNIRRGTLVRLIMLDHYGDVPLHQDGRRIAGARLMPGLWRIRELRESPGDWPAAIVEPTSASARDLTDWRTRLKEAVRDKVSSQRPNAPLSDIEAETERRFQRLMQLEVPSDAELREMQERGELASDEALARAYP